MCVLCVSMRCCILYPVFRIPYSVCGRPDGFSAQPSSKQGRFVGGGMIGYMECVLPEEGSPRGTLAY